MPVELKHPVSHERSRISTHSSEKSLTIIFGSIAAFLGAIGIGGLLFGIDFLSAVVPEFKPIGVPAAISWFFFGLVLTLHAKNPQTGIKLNIVTAFLAVIAITAALDLPLKLMGRSFLVEDLVNGFAATIMAGRITPVSPVATFLIILSAIALFVLLRTSKDLPDNQRTRDIAGITGLSIVLMSFTVLLSYGLGTPLLYKTTIIPIAFTSALAALFTGLGLITSAGSSSAPLRYLTGQTVQSRLLRFLLPLMVTIVLVEGLLQTTLVSVYHIDNVIQLSIGLMLFCLITVFFVSKIVGDVSQVIEREEEKRRQVEWALAESERKYWNLYHYAQVGLFETSFKDARVVACNQRYCTLFGFPTIEEAIGKNVLGLYVNPDERKEVAQILKENGSIENYTGRFRNQATGKEFWGQFSARYNYERDVAEGSIIDISAQKEAEAHLKETNEYLTSLFDNANAPIIVWDPAFRITRFNHAFENLTGRTEQEVIGQHLAILFPESSRNASLELIRRTVSGERWKIVEIPIRHISGEVRIVLWNSANIVDPLGTLISTIAQGQDITERKAAEEKIKLSETRYRRLFESAKDGILILHKETGEIIDANPFMEYLTGYSREELIGRHLWDIGFFKDSLASKIAFNELQEKEYIRYEDLPLKTKDGKIKDVEFVSNVYPIDHISVIQCNIRDISDRKLAEEALKKNEYKFQILADFTYDWAYWIDTDLHMVYTSPSCEQITGYSPEDFMGNPDLMVTIVYPGDREIYLNHRSDMHDKPAMGMLEFRILHRDGSVRWLGHVCRPIFDSDGQFLGTRVSNRDITEQKALEQQREALIKELEQKNAELERFTYTVSHDLKSPLITIKGFAGLLEDDARKDDPVQLRKDILRINEAADTMQQLLTEVLELSRIGRVVSPFENIPFGIIAQEAVDLLAVQLAARGVTVRIAPNLPVVNVDHARIREVMVNLLENAIKFFGDRPDPEIRIGVDSSGKTPVFFVQDNGIGIESKYLERIFKLFEKLNISVAGTGVGLTIVRRIIEFHGGKIWAESDGPGKGTTFRFTLPGPDVSAESK